VSAATTVQRDTKREILDAAEAMIQELGYNGFSYQHIADLLGIKNAAVHYHFRSKADLGAEVIERYRRRFQRWAEQLEVQRKGVHAKLEAFFQIYYDLSNNGQRACPAGMLQAEFNAIPEEVREATRGLMIDLQEWLTGLLAQGREAGAFRFPGEPADQAVVIAATLQGALQIARSCGPERFDAAVAQLKRQLAG